MNSSMAVETLPLLPASRVGRCAMGRRLVEGMHVIGAITLESIG